MGSVLLKGGFSVTPESTNRRDIIISDDRIDFNIKKTDCDKVIDVTDKYILPGFVDNHFHGYNLFDFTVGQFE